MSAIARLGGVAAAAAAAVALAAASRVPIPAHTTDHALLRVAWSARPERIESCRTLGEEELAALPAHMRQREVCEGVTASYRLEVLRDGTLLDTATVRGGGLRRDRQLYVFRELRVPSGPATFEVRLTRREAAAVDTAAADGGAASAPGDGVDPARRELDERGRRVADEVPPALALREAVTLDPREVLLVTYDRGTRRLITVRGP